MKKTIITLAIILVGITGAFAQFEKGRMLIGGSLGFSSTSEDWEQGSNSITAGKTTTISFAPQFGYFVMDNLAVGAAIDFTNSKFKPDNDAKDFLSEYTETSTQFQPFVRYYLPAKIFFQGNVGFGSTKTEDTFDGDTDKYEAKLFSWGLGAGYAIMLSDNVAIEPLLGYSSVKETDDSSDPEFVTTYGGLFLRVGVQVYIGGGK